MSHTPDWIMELPQSASAWFQTIMDDGPIWGRFRDSVDTIVPYYLSATGRVVYTFEWLKAPFPGETPENLRARAEWALPMQNEETTFFIDAELEKLLPPRVADFPVALSSFRRTVTGKTMYILDRAGVSPRFPVHMGGSRQEPEVDPDQFMQKILALDWSNPWGAGSHTSRFLSELYDKYIQKGREEYIPAFKRGIEFFLSKQNPETGMWGDDSMQLMLRLSGALKALGFVFWNLRLLPYAERIADTVLDVHRTGALYANDPDGNALRERNAVDLATMCYTHTDYRKEELRAYIESVADAIAKYLQPDGAFASHPSGTTAITWNGPRLAEPCEKPRSDMKGTETALYALGLLGAALDWEDFPLEKNERIERFKQPDTRPYKVVLDEKGSVEVVKR